jgi:hypothetical protein
LQAVPRAKKKVNPKKRANRVLKEKGTKVIPKSTTRTAMVINKPKLNVKDAKPILVELPTDRVTLDWWKCYLDSCATHHTFFIKKKSMGVHKSKTTMNGSCKQALPLLIPRGGMENSRYG